MHAHNLPQSALLFNAAERLLLCKLPNFPLTMARPTRGYIRYIYYWKKCYTHYMLNPVD